MGAEPRPLLVRATSVHGFWLQAPLVVVALDASGRVIAAVRLERRRVVTVPGSEWMLDLPPSHPRPAPGRSSPWFSVRGGPEAEAGPPVLLRPPDRQPQARLASARPHPAGG